MLAIKNSYGKVAVLVL